MAYSLSSRQQRKRIVVESGRNAYEKCRPPTRSLGLKVGPNASSDWRCNLFSRKLSGAGGMGEVYRATDTQAGSYQRQTPESVY